MAANFSALSHRAARGLNPFDASDVKRLFQSQVTKTLNEARTIAEDWRQHALSRGFTDVKSQ